MTGPDVFISYAHVDNEKSSDEGLGWVTHFRNNLRLELARAIGRKERIDIWMDSKLEGNDAITSEIEEKLRTSHTLCILLSPGWIASEWCQKELTIFCDSHPNLKHRIYVIELNELKPVQKHTAFRDLKGYRFWYKNEEDRTRLRGFPEPQVADTVYFGRLSDISFDVSQALSNFRPEITTITQTFIPKATIYIAPVIDAMYDQRATLVNELKQFEIAVLPEKNTILNTDIAIELTKCSHFVQLLGADSMIGIPRQQLAIAEQTGKPVMQWRDPQLNITADSINSEHKQLLEHKTVIAATLPDFIRMVREAVLPKEKPNDIVEPTVSSGQKMVFVHAGQEDFHHAQRITDFLYNKGYGFTLPQYEGTPERIRKTIERGFQFCSILLILQQKTPAEAVEDQLAEAQFHAQKRESKFDILLCRDPAAEALGFVPANTKLFNCNSNFHEHCLEQFLQQVEA